MNKGKIAEIHEFWFGPINEDGNVSETTRTRWWQKNAAFDTEIKEKFEEDIQNAMIGEYAAWCDSADGRLACIILIDQFCRNIYRHKPDAWAHDHLAQAWALEGLKKDHDKALPHVKRAFMYMPFMHAENDELQQLSVRLFEELAKTAPSAAVKEKADDAYQYALRHKDIVDRFGRYPHRNEILGRESTPEEIAFLQEPNSSF